MDDIIYIKNLSFDYPDKKEVLSDINLTIKAGEDIALIGRNGAGKSTLLMSMVGILSVVGEIEISGIKMKKENLGEIRRRVGFVFQNPDDQLFMPTIFDDISFGPLNFGFSKDETEKKVKDVLKIVGLEGYDFRKPHHLSLGEKKRAAIATILVLEPEVIIFDEPTLALDPGGCRKIIKFIKSIKSTKIVATHDLEMVLELCNRVILMDNGKIVADGNTKEILADRKLMYDTGMDVISSLSV